ncbi:histidine kinase [Gracilibacillus sp. S3-1-1]|uniref:Histidine kinase n=1 Tax=Gracilibacillus pellucidus TaxID=3095368 RepID=A0ACC6M3G7_9BACI|nr:histidine kinase [Gracilibacillus sp. S3-1-1]MDX8045504.1 histidine kinase [Gracilibacillus sp. S3-1-1]
MALDLQTLLLVIGIINFMGLTLMIVLWRINSTVKGPAFWTLSSVSWFVSFISIYFFNGSLITFLNNSCTLTGAILLMEGIIRFRGFGNDRKRQKLLIALILLSIIMSFINQTNPTARYLYHDFIVVVVAVISIVAMLYKTNKVQFWVHLYTAISIALIIPIFSYRWYLAFSGQIEEQLIGPTQHTFQVLLVLSTIPLYIGWPLGLGLALSYQMRQELKSAMEAKWLQAQIQPHFIFNTLNSINALSIVDVDKMRRLVDEFSEFLRSKFDSHSFNRWISLDEEISIVESYLYIEKVRFGNRLKVLWDVEVVKGFYLPTLTIQPIVENAVKHGIMKQASGGTIEIKAFKKKDYVRVIIKDNGVGMSEDSVRSIKQMDLVNSVGVGLNNTNRRLIEGFGSGLQIRSKMEVGTVIAFNMTKNDSQEEKPNNYRCSS